MRSIKQILLLVCFTSLSAYAASAQNASSSPTPCPTVTINHPTTAQGGAIIEFNAQLTSGVASSYSWTVEPNVRTSGSDTPTLVILDGETHGLPDVKVTVTVRVNGCEDIVKNATTTIRGTALAFKLGQYTEQTLELREPLREISRKRLLVDPTASIYLIPHERRQKGGGINPLSTEESDSSSEAYLMAQADMQALGTGTNQERVKILRGAPEEYLTVEFYLVPKGAVPPPANAPATLSTLSNDVSLMWTVLPQSVVKDNFGNSVKKKFYCIEMRISNNTGYEFQLSATGFTVPGLMQASAGQSLLPATDYRIVRGSLQRGQQTGVRNRSLALIKGTGLLLTGFTPFFRATNRRANFSALVNILSNPLEAGLEMLFPDNTVRYLENLDELALRVNSSTRVFIPNNGQLITYIFLPKDLLNIDKQKRDNPQEVRRALGDLIVFGNTIQQIQRIRATEQR